MAIIDGTNGLIQAYDYQTPTTGISVSNSTTGVSVTNANLPPYVVAYVWKRTA